MVSEEIQKFCPLLKPEDIAASVLYVLGAPPNVQVRERVTSRPTTIFRRSFHVIPSSRFSLEKLTVAKMFKFHYHVHNSPPPVTDHSQINPV